MIKKSASILFLRMNKLVNFICVEFSMNPKIQVHAAYRLGLSEKSSDFEIQTESQDQQVLPQHHYASLYRHRDEMHKTKMEASFNMNGILILTLENKKFILQVFTRTNQSEA